MMTRKDYINSPRDTHEDSHAIHRQYYGQFVTEEVKNAVEERFGMEALIKAYAKDPSLNSIPLAHWDALTLNIKRAVNADSIKEAGEGWSFSTGVCILKEAARQLLERIIH